MLMPWASRQSPLSEQIDRDSQAWMCGHGFVGDSSSIRSGLLAGRLYPDASYVDLRLVSDWILLFCLLDDIIEQEPDLASFMLYLDRPPALMQALDDIRFRAPLTWGVVLVTLLEAFLVERRYQTWAPDMPAYNDLRAITVGMGSVLALLGTLVPDALARLASLVIGYQNDLFTYRREQGQLNLVTVLKGQLGVSTKFAAHIGHEMHDQMIADFQVLSVNEDPAVVLILELMMAGHLAWAYETGRYQC